MDVTGVFSKSWIDAGNRDWFENAPVARMQVAGSLDFYGEVDANRLCAPVVQGGEKLAAIRDAIAVRDATPREALPAAPGVATRPVTPAATSSATSTATDAAPVNSKP